jgi:hypothetical protein
MAEQRTPDEVREQIRSLEGYLANTTKGLKKVRQARGADAYKKAWELDAQKQRYEERIEALRQELKGLEAES